MDGELKEHLIRYMGIAGFDRADDLLWQRKDDVSNLIVAVVNINNTPHIEIVHGDTDKDIVYCQYGLRPLTIVETPAGFISFVEKKIQDARSSQVLEELKRREDMRLGHLVDSRQAKPL